jgi:hypothetical protein
MQVHLYSGKEAFWVRTEASGPLSPGGRQPAGARTAGSGPARPVPSPPSTLSSAEGGGDSRQPDPLPVIGPDPGCSRGDGDGRF